MDEVTILGCGIVGLTTAIALQNKGFRVNIISKEKYSETLSSKVGAIWFPFEVFPKERTNRWAAQAYQVYNNDQKTGNGISFIPFLTSYNQDSNTDWTKLLPTDRVRKALPTELPKGIQNAFVAIVPLAEPFLYLPYLFNTFIQKGGEFKQQEINSLDEASQLNSVVVNCTGLGAKKLCMDMDLHPMRGQILRCKKMDIPSCADSINKGDLSYIINRSEDCVIGGTDYEHNWNTQVDPRDTKLIVQRLMDGGLSNNPPEILEEIVGLRPKRSRVRFEFDKHYANLFHNYGHGGAGFTVAWGCAIEMGDILSQKQNEY